MKRIRTIACTAGAILLLLGVGRPAWATNYSGTLNFSSYPTTMTIDVLGTPVVVNIGVDVARYDLGNALSGPTDVSFSASGFTPDRTMLGLVFTTDPNNALFNNPTSLAGIINPSTNVTTFMNNNVAGWQYFAYGNVITPGGTTNVSAMFNPMTFTAGTTYYAFVIGGSSVVSGALVDPSVGYTLSVGAVPEPGEWAMMMAGLGFIGLLRRRKEAALV